MELSESCRRIIGERLRKRRVQIKGKNGKFMTQEELADIVQMSHKEICAIENGTKLPRLGTIHKLCRALDMSADYLLFGKADRDLSTLE